ncbi:LVIVD repeat-containing protein [Nocardioides piscis]|uniref:LVIVD repeat-containing protein n=1 Tax=Nocardioides piscis TaxID=2714938 RepID=A0A6G7YDJ1_9ACTN|nr:hypothetical protein [Nocardioides piscis]QIK74677.1 hypothetical protein G7071_03810 [Nocardioides piscis]
MTLQRRRTTAHTQRPPRHRRQATAVAVMLGASLLLAAPVAASDEGHAHEEAAASTVDPRCTDKERAALRAAGDNFALACQPGRDLTDMGPNSTSLSKDEVASSPNMRLRANIPKQGEFAGTGGDRYNSDLAFQGKYAYAGNYNGFMVYDISEPTTPVPVTQVVCPGPQNDISVWGDILVMSVDSSRNDASCNSTAQSATIESSWEGIRVFDISDPLAPEYVAGVETDCGSHTHTLAPSKDGEDLFVYVSSYFPSASFPDCQPPHDKISVVKIPTDDMASAALAGTPVLFPDGGNPTGNYSRETTGCHDITAYPEKDIAAGACMGDGVLLDISDRANPVVTERVQDRENFAFWHSATFNNTGTKVVFTDELGGGGGATCNPDIGPERGANGIYDIVAGELVFKSYYKISRTQSNTENCVAHNGSLIPVKGKDIMVQAWYQGGVSVYDFTDSANPKEIGWWDRGPVDETKLVLGGSWSAYYYNGYIYSNEIQRGFDVLEINDRRTAPAKGVRMDIFNPQSQPSYNG